MKQFRHAICISPDEGNKLLLSASGISESKSHKFTGFQSVSNAAEFPPGIELLVIDLASTVPAKYYLSWETPVANTLSLIRKIRAGDIESRGIPRDIGIVVRHKDVDWEHYGVMKHGSEEITQQPSVEAKTHDDILAAATRGNATNTSRIEAARYAQNSVTIQPVTFADNQELLPFVEVNTGPKLRLLGDDKPPLFDFLVKRELRVACDVARKITGITQATATGPAKLGADLKPRTHTNAADNPPGGVWTADPAKTD